MPTMQAIHADLTSLSVDVIVNTANEQSPGGSGVDGAVQRAAGPELKRFCSILDGCADGEAFITPGFDLPAKWVIHAAGPKWRGGAAGEAELLAACYRRSISIAEERGLRSIAFSSISTGAYGYPMVAATEIAVSAVSNAVERTTVIGEVVFCCISPQDLACYRSILMQPS